MSWAALTAIGTVLAGLALPLAFFQLGTLREDRRRAQVSKVGAWMDLRRAAHTRPAETVVDEWEVTLFVRNASELPVRVSIVVLGPSGGQLDAAHPGTIPPGQTWKDVASVRDYDDIIMLGITAMTVTDAAGNLWQMRPTRGGLPHRIRWRRWWEYRVRWRGWWEYRRLRAKTRKRS